MQHQRRGPGPFVARRISVIALGITSLVQGILAALTCRTRFRAFPIGTYFAVLGIISGASCVWAAFTGRNAGVRMSVSGLIGLIGLIVSIGSLVASLVVWFVLP